MQTLGMVTASIAGALPPKCGKVPAIKYERWEMQFLYDRYLPAMVLLGLLCMLPELLHVLAIYVEHRRCYTKARVLERGLRQPEYLVV